MNRRFVLVTLALPATAAFLVGLIVAGSLTPTTARSDNRGAPVRPVAARTVSTAGGVNFADIAERINPAVVNIDATWRGRLQLPEGHPMPPELFSPGADGRGDADLPRKGA